MSSNIRIDFSHEDTADDVIYDLMKIESDVYDPQYRGVFESIQKRFHKYKEMFILAYDEDEIIGYLCFFPISEKLHNQLLQSEGFHDDDISPKDVMCMGTMNFIYILSVAVYKRYRGRGIGEAMHDAFFKKMKAEKEKGHTINDILISVVTERGEKSAKRYGFTLVHDYSGTAHYKLYRRDL